MKEETAPPRSRTMTPSAPRDWRRAIRILFRPDATCSDSPRTRRFATSTSVRVPCRWGGRREPAWRLCLTPLYRPCWSGSIPNAGSGAGFGAKRRPRRPGVFPAAAVRYSGAEPESATIGQGHRMAQGTQDGAPSSAPTEIAVRSRLVWSTTTSSPGPRRKLRGSRQYPPSMPDAYQLEAGAGSGRGRRSGGPKEPARGAQAERNITTPTWRVLAHHHPRGGNRVGQLRWLLGPRCAR